MPANDSDGQTRRTPNKNFENLNDNSNVNINSNKLAEFANFVNGF